VVQARVSGETVEGASSTSLGILGGVDEAANTGGVERAGAHGAGFEGCIEGTLSEAPATEFACGATQGEELGVGRWVTEGLTLIMGHGQNFSVSSDYCADGNLSLLSGQRSLFQGVAHQAQVHCGLGVLRLHLFWTAVAAGFVVWFKFVGHGVDNSNVRRDMNSAADQLGAR
jgi:hypothetical protein